MKRKKGKSDDADQRAQKLYFRLRQAYRAPIDAALAGLAPDRAFRAGRAYRFLQLFASRLSEEDFVGLLRGERVDVPALHYQDLHWILFAGQ